MYIINLLSHRLYDHQIDEIERATQTGTLKIINFDANIMLDKPEEDIIYELFERVIEKPTLPVVVVLPGLSAFALTLYNAFFAACLVLRRPFFVAFQADPHSSKLTVTSAFRVIEEEVL